MKQTRTDPNAEFTTVLQAEVTGTTADTLIAVTGMEATDVIVSVYGATAGPALTDYTPTAFAGGFKCTEDTSTIALLVTYKKQ